MMINNGKLFTFRSAIEAYQRCPRSRYLNYHYDGKGLVPAVEHPALTTGTAVHAALEALFKGEEYEIVLPDPEQQAIARALVWVWREYYLDEFLNRYEVLSVEEEVLWEISPDITVLVRADALIRDKEDSNIFVLNFKTVSRHPLQDGRKESSLYHNLQGLIETAAMTDTLMKLKAQYETAIPALGALAKFDRRAGKMLEVLKRSYENQAFYVSGFKMIFLIKGERRGKGEEKALYSPLVRGYKKNGQYSASYKTGWEPVKTWEEPGLETWLKQLPRDVATAQIFVPHEFYVSVDPTTVAQEIINQEREVLSRLSAGIEAFPMFRHSCDYPLSCPYQAICWGPPGVDPLQQGYVYRTPHHSTEVQNGE